MLATESKACSKYLQHVLTYSYTPVLNLACYCLVTEYVIKPCVPCIGTEIFVGTHSQFPTWSNFRAYVMSIILFSTSNHYFLHYGLIHAYSQ